MSTTGFVSQEIARMRSSILEYCVERFWLSGVHAVMQIILFLFIALMMALVLPVELIHAETNQETFSREEQYCQRLREGGLYEILEGYINRKLKQPRLTEELRLLYTLELGRTYADHATTISGESQQLYWQQSFDLLNKEIAAHPESTGILRVKVEKSCLMAVKTQHYCRVLELISDPQNYKNQVIKDGTQAVIELESLSKELNDLIKSQGEKIKAGRIENIPASTS